MLPLKHKRIFFGRTLFSLWIIGAGTSVGQSAKAQNIVANGGFETGTLSPWAPNTTGNVQLSVNNTSAFNHSGNYHALFASTPSATAGTGALTQTLDTLPNQAYLITFWASENNFGKTGGTDPFEVSWSGSLLGTVAIPNDSTYRQYTYTVQATSDSTDLSFSALIDAAGDQYINLDDVVVTATPEPGSITLILSMISISTVFLVRKRRHKATGI